MNNPPFVSVIIPCRNEEKFIGNVLEGLQNQDYPGDRWEAIVADGMSDDDTRKVIHKFADKDNRFTLIENPAQVVPHALNACIKESKGEVIIRLDAHSVYPENYISRLVSCLIEYNADNVGGVWKTTPANDTLMAKAVAISNASAFGIGNANYRLANDKIRDVDTVPFGCYRREVFDRIGFFDEDLVRNQDDEFNGRLIQSGGKILLIPDVEITYYARTTFSKMSKMFYQYGLYKPLVNKKLRHPATLRQFIPPLFVLGLLSGILWYYVSTPLFFLWCLAVGLYILTNFMVSLRLAVRNKIMALVPLLFNAFLTIHFSYGIGYLEGLIVFSLFRKSSKKLRPNR